MFWISDFIAALAFSQLVLLGMYFFLKCEGTLARLISLYSLCLSAYALASMTFAASSPIASYVLFRLATLAPFLLWFIAFVMFVDNDKISNWAWATIGYFVIARSIGMGIALFYPAILQNNFGYTIIYFLPQIILLFFSINTIYLAWAGHRADLVEQRRRIRISFIVVMGIILIAIVGTDFINLLQRYVPMDWFTNLYPLPGALVSLYIFLTAFLFNIAIFRISENALQLLTDVSIESGSPAPTLAARPTKSSEHVEQLAALMLERKLYVQTGLTIADLAKELKMQEYRLRRLINQQLGYRNFNQFLNNYRIDEARKLLLQSEASISNIALDVGYASLSVFNKAFKERYNLTPREYRTQHRSETLNKENPA